MASKTTRRLYCACGAAWVMTVPERVLEWLLGEWERLHTGEGHAPTDARGARRARDAERAA